MKCYNAQALINSLGEDDLADLGIYLLEDGTVKGLENIQFPVDVSVLDRNPLGQWDWDNVEEGRFDLDGERPEQYARGC